MMFLRVVLVILPLINPMGGGPTPARRFVIGELGRQSDAGRRTVALALWNRAALHGMAGIAGTAMAHLPMLERDAATRAVQPSTATVPMAADRTEFEGGPIRLGPRLPPSQLRPTHRLRERDQFEGPPRSLGRRGKPGACPPPIGGPQLAPRNLPIRSR